MIYEIWLDAFSFWAFTFFLGIAIGIWIGVAHGSQIARAFARFRPGPKVTPQTARGVLFQMQDQPAGILPPLPEEADYWDIYGVVDGKHIKLNDKA